jgi:hypothetical protein
MTALTLLADIDAAKVTVTLEWAVARAFIVRVTPDGRSVPVRNAEPATLTAGTVVLDDFECPLDTVVYYVARSLESEDTVTSADVTLASDARMWLKHPGRPVLNINIVLALTPDRARELAATIQPALGRRNVVSVTDGRRHGPTAELTLRTTTIAQANALRTILDDGSPLLLQAPDGYDIGSVWIQPMEFGEKWLIRYLPDERRVWTLSFATVDRPAGLAFNAAINTWGGVVANFESWAALIAEYDTWGDLLLAGTLAPEDPYATPPADVVIPETPPGGAILMGVAATANAAEATTAAAEFTRIETASLTTFTIQRCLTADFPATFDEHPSFVDVGVRASLCCVTSDITRMKNGLDDDLVIGFVNSIPDGHITYLTWQYEADNPANGNTPATVRAAGARFASLVKSVRGTRPIYVTWCPMGYTFAPSSGRDPLDWYWGSGVEVIAPTCYNPSHTAEYNMDSGVYVGALQAHAFAAAHGKRFGLAEWACYDQVATDRDGFIADGFAYLDGLYSPACEFACWYHTDLHNADGDGWWLDTSVGSLDAWKLVT